MDAINPSSIQALRLLKKHRGALTPQQFKTIKGQVLAGDIAGALKGLEKITKGKAKT